jgi:hypothetical protein
VRAHAVGAEQWRERDWRGMEGDVAAATQDENEQACRNEESEVWATWHTATLRRVHQ